LTVHGITLLLASATIPQLYCVLRYMTVSEVNAVSTLDDACSLLTLRNKKLCRCRGTARRTCQ